MLKVTGAHGKKLQKGKGLFLLFVRTNIHHHKLCLAVLGYQHRLAGLGDLLDDLGRVALEVANWLDLG
ncbi:hypothetical protein D3C72_1621100 [compost metagenome]